MHAIAHDHYGPPETLELRTLPIPTPEAHQVVVRVRAATVAIGDCFAVRGSPFAMRLSTGLLSPRHHVPGWDLCGTVEAVGDAVTRFRVGDRVFGVTQEGSCAEYARTTEDLLVPASAAFSSEELAAIPTAALAALHGLRDVARVTPGQRVLINGAAGGIGTFAVQIAKHFGAIVTGVCGPGSVELVRSLGADHVIDYTHDDFTAHGRSYDVIFDNVENRPLSACRRALSRHGVLVLNSGTGAHGWRMLVRLVKPFVVSPFVRQRLRRYLSKPNRADLELIAGLVNDGTLRPVIDSAYPLTQVPAALLHVESGHAHGKVVVRV